MGLWESLQELYGDGKDLAWEGIDAAEPLLQFVEPSYSTENLRNKTNQLHDLAAGRGVAGMRDWGKEALGLESKIMADEKVKAAILGLPLVPMAAAAAPAMVGKVASMFGKTAPAAGGLLKSLGVPAGLYINDQLNQPSAPQQSPQEQLMAQVEPQAQVQPQSSPLAQFIGAQEGDLTADDIKQAFLSGGTIKLKGDQKLANDVRGISKYDQDKQTKNLGMTAPSSLPGDIATYQKMKSDLLAQQKPMMDALVKQMNGAATDEQRKKIEQRIQALSNQVELEAANYMKYMLPQDRRQNFVGAVNFSSPDRAPEDQKAPPTSDKDAARSEEDSWMWDFMKYAAPAAVAVLAAKYGGLKHMKGAKDAASSLAKNVGMLG